MRCHRHQPYPQRAAEATIPPVLHSSHPADGPRSTLVQLKRGSGDHSVLVLPGVAGSVLGLVWLARSYPGPEHVVGLESMSLGATAGPPRSVAELAAANVATATAAESDRSGGRWHLVGHGFGATVALEMAHQLERAGQPLGAIALLQPLLRLGGPLEDEELRGAEMLRAAADRLRGRLESAGAGVPADDSVAEDLRCLGLDASLLRLDAGLGERILRNVDAALCAYRDHAPRPISAPVHLLGPSDHGSGEAAARLTELTGGVSRHELPCPPDAALRQPCVRAVASTVASLVAAAGRGVVS